MSSKIFRFINALKRYNICILFVEYFTNYDKLMQNSGDQSVISGSGALLSDPHIFIPLISGLICTVAVIICTLIVIKRKYVVIK